MALYPAPKIEPGGLALPPSWLPQPAHENALAVTGAGPLPLLVLSGLVLIGAGLIVLGARWASRGA